MGVTAAIIGLAGSAYGSSEQRKAGKRASREAKAAEARALKREEESARKLAESTPNRSMDATRRIAMERAFLKRTSGRGRSGAVKSSLG